MRTLSCAWPAGGRAARGRYVITDARLPRELAAFPEALTIGLAASPAVRAVRLAQRDGSRYQPLHHVTETWAATLLTQCDVVLVNDEVGLEAFHARYETEVLPRLAAHFTQRTTVTAS